MSPLAIAAVAGYYLLVLLVLRNVVLWRRERRQERTRGGIYAMVYTNGHDGHRAYVVDLAMPTAPMLVGTVNVPEPIIGISRGIPPEHREAVVALLGGYTKKGTA